MLCMRSPSLNYVQRYFTLFYVHTTPEEFENTDIFIRLGLPPTNDYSDTKTQLYLYG